MTVGNATAAAAAAVLTNATTEYKLRAGRLGIAPPSAAAHTGAAVAGARPEAARALVAAHSGAAAHAVRRGMTAGRSRSTRTRLADVCVVDVSVDDTLPHVDYLSKFDADGPAAARYAGIARVIDKQLIVATDQVLPHPGTTHAAAHNGELHQVAYTAVTGSGPHDHVGAHSSDTEVLDCRGA